MKRLANHQFRQIIILHIKSRLSISGELALMMADNLAAKRLSTSAMAKQDRAMIRLILAHRHIVDAESTVVKTKNHSYRVVGRTEQKDSDVMVCTTLFTSAAAQAKHDQDCGLAHSCRKRMFFQRIIYPRCRDCGSSISSALSRFTPTARDYTQNSPHISNVQRPRAASHSRPVVDTGDACRAFAATMQLAARQPDKSGYRTCVLILNMRVLWTRASITLAA